MNSYSAPITDEMVTRFLSWRLPDSFSPDCGISFKRTYNEGSPFGTSTYEPTGTNLLSADQARVMLEYVLAAPSHSAPSEPTINEFNVGRYCLSEDDCIAEGLNFAAYERGIADAAAAFSRSKK